MKNEIITKRKKRIAIIFLCFIFIIQAFTIVGCTSDNTDAGAGGGDSDVTTQVIEEIEINMCRAYVDYGVLTLELINEINSAWMQRSGNSQPLIESIDALKYDTQSGSVYLGLYNGYYIFMSGYGIISTGPTYSIANHEFFLGSANFELVGYKDGAFSLLGDLYKSGELSYKDIATINDRFYEIFLYVIAYQDISRDITVSVPRMPVIQLNEDEDRKIKETLVRYIPEINNVTAESDDICITAYYGTYNGAFVFNYRTDLIVYSGGDFYYESIGNASFVYHGNTFMLGNKKGNVRIYVYYDDSIYTLSEAYEKSLLTDGDVEIIKKYHTAYHPFNLDEFANLQSYSPTELK